MQHDHHHRQPSAASSQGDGYDYDYYSESDAADDDDEHTDNSQHDLYAPFPQPPDNTQQQHQQQHLQSHTAPARQLGQKASLAAITVPPFTAFRAQLPSAVPAHRPPVPPYAAAFQHQPSPRAASFSLAESASPRLADPTTRPASYNSQLVPQTPTSIPIALGTPVDPRQLWGQGNTAHPSQPIGHDYNEFLDPHIHSTAASSTYSSPQQTSIPFKAEHAQDPHTSHRPNHSISSDYASNHSSARSSMIATQRAPVIHMDHIEPVRRTQSDDSLGAASTSSLQRPKSPIDRLGSLFGWSGPQKADGDSSPTTTFSEQSLSPLPSPRLVKTLAVDTMTGRRASARLTPPTLDISKANAATGYFENPETPLLLGNGASNVHVQELERELSHISSELANSIRREMELEDELDRLRADYPAIPPSDRRTSDYFSDSGASSTKFPITDPDAKIESLEKHVRKVEQDKANMKVETASRLQTELSRRRDLEELVQNLEDQLDKRATDGHPPEKVEELESSLDETRRRLGQEKESKENFEELYSATKEELARLRNEADNLRNEVVPQLRARVEGLEAEAAEHQGLAYENTRLQQELSNLRESNHSRFNSIAEDGIPNPARMSMNRSSSMARSSSLRRGASVKDQGGRARAGSNSVAYADGLKEIEDQRDALHKALKLLIRRHEKSQREHERAVRKLTNAKDKAEQITPKRTAYTKEVAFLKEEVTTLRKRTEDALEQKWQYEKNLSGLKMDLDRAEQETRGLRIILQENDANAPSERSVSGEDEEDDQLKLSISRAENERDHARKIAEDYRQRAQSAGGSKSTELMNSAKRMEDLAGQLESQVQANAQLRERLTSAIAKGDKEQKDSTRKIEEMQRRLAGMEDSVLAAQQHSETTLANHDAEVRRIEDASSPHLQRLRVSIPDASKLGPPSPLLKSNKLGPPSPLLKKSPKLGSKKLSETSLLEMSRTQMLERKVKELEGLLREAEEDMQLVVQRVNKSQMEVAELQTERDAALTQMRKLQDLIVQERERAEAL